jgi:hypothetical protein
MLSAAELRARQAEKLSSRKDEFSSRFRKATEGYYEAIMREVKLALEAVQDSSFTYVILNFKPLTEDFEGLKYTTMLYGYWIKDREAFDDSIFAEQEVEKPFERAKKELAELGYRLENVSDPKVSKKLFIKLSWGEGESSSAPRPRRVAKPRIESESQISTRRVAKPRIESESQISTRRGKGQERGVNSEKKYEMRDMEKSPEEKERSLRKREEERERDRERDREYDRSRNMRRSPEPESDSESDSERRRAPKKLRWGDREAARDIKKTEDSGRREKTRI